ncbi:MAG: MBL fold metallo-hydrolase [Candidatus Hodarchaeota archaeon]
MNSAENTGYTIVFLGTAAAIRVPSFHCTCSTCEAARKDTTLQRTRASVAILGKETILIDAGPDVEFQLERESIRHIDRIFLTHWHYDHCWGLAAFPEPSTHGTWGKTMIDLYLPEESLDYFDSVLGYAKEHFILHPVNPGDSIQLPDGKYDVLKTNHTKDSVGYILKYKNHQKIAYLPDSGIPPPVTIKKLQEEEVDILMLDGTVDRLNLPDGEKWYACFEIEEAIDFWQNLKSPTCIITHLSCHSWNIDRLEAGITEKDRKTYEENHPGLKFAYDGLKIKF